MKRHASYGREVETQAQRRPVMTATRDVAAGRAHGHEALGPAAHATHTPHAFARPQQADVVPVLVELIAELLQ